MAAAASDHPAPGVHASQLERYATTRRNAGTRVRGVGRYNRRTLIARVRIVETSSRQFADVIVAVPVGRVDHHSAPALEAALAPLIKTACAGKGMLALDFAGVDYISSAGLRILMVTAKELRAAGAKIAVADLKPVVAEIFAISRFDRVLGVFPSVRAAIEQCSPTALAAFDAAQPTATR